MKLTKQASTMFDPHPASKSRRIAESCFDGPSKTLLLPQLSFLGDTYRGGASIAIKLDFGICDSCSLDP